MKKLFLIIFLTGLVLMGFSQRVKWIVVADTVNTFSEPVTAFKTAVFIKSDSLAYYITSNYSISQSMDDVFTDGEYKIVSGGGSSGETDSTYFNYLTGKLTAKSAITHLDVNGNIEGNKFLIGGVDVIEQEGVGAIWFGRDCGAGYIPVFGTDYMGDEASISMQNKTMTFSFNKISTSIWSGTGLSLNSATTPTHNLFVNGDIYTVDSIVTETQLYVIGSDSIRDTYNKWGTTVATEVRFNGSYGDISSNFTGTERIILNGGSCDEEIVTATSVDWEGDWEYTYFNVTPNTTCIDYTSFDVIIQEIENGTIYVNNVVSSTGTIADNDATPDVSRATVWTYGGSANSVTITDLDNPIVGAIYTLIGNSDTYTITIADAGNFNLSAQWVGGIDDVLTLYIQADNDYIQLYRSDN